MKGLPQRQLRRAAGQVQLASAAATPTLAYGLTHGTELLPRHPVDAARAGELARLPLIIGTNSHEASMFAWTRPPMLPTTRATVDRYFDRVAPEAKDAVLAAYPAYPRRSALITIGSDVMFGAPTWAFADAYNGRAPTRVYRFDHAGMSLRLLGLGATHGSEIVHVQHSYASFIGRKLHPLGRRFQPAVGARMQRAWLDFACSDRVHDEANWPLYDVDHRRTRLIASSRDVVEEGSRPRTAGSLGSPDLGHRAGESTVAVEAGFCCTASIAVPQIDVCPVIAVRLGEHGAHSQQRKLVIQEDGFRRQRGQRVDRGAGAVEISGCAPRQKRLDQNRRRPTAIDALACPPFFVQDAACEVHGCVVVTGPNGFCCEVQIDAPRGDDGVPMVQRHRTGLGQQLETQCAVLVLTADEDQSIREFGVGEQEVVAELAGDLERFGSVPQRDVVRRSAQFMIAMYLNITTVEKLNLSTLRAIVSASSKSSRQPAIPRQQRVDARIARAIASGEPKMMLPIVGSPSTGRSRVEPGLVTRPSRRRPTWRSPRPSESSPPRARDRRWSRAVPPARRPVGRPRCSGRGS